MRRLFALPLAVLASACLQAPHDRQAELHELRAWMSGAFSSEAQHLADPQNYLHIVLHMQPIWLERTDGAWLYVEQAAASRQDKPYRQRIYRLRMEADGAAWSDVYTLPGDPLQFAGAWQEPTRFAALDPAELTLREGCSIRLERVEGAWQGATLGSACPSELRGAAFATSEARIEPVLLTSWDRGYGADGKQVWGATLGPYRFVKQ